MIHHHPGVDSQEDCYWAAEADAYLAAERAAERVDIDDGIPAEDDTTPADVIPADVRENVAEMIAERSSIALANVGEADAPSTDVQADGVAAPTPKKRPILRASEASLDGLLRRPPPPRRYLLRHPTLDGQACAPRMGDGFLPVEVVGLLASEGGTGKTMVLLQLAVAIATGRPWLDFHVDREHVGGRVLIAAAEETLPELWRRLWRIAEHLRLDEAERIAVERCVRVLPLAGRPCSLVEEYRVEGETLRRTTQNYDDLFELLVSDGGPWSAVLLDPLARLAPDAEGSNPSATFAIQAAEQLTEVPGGPLVLIAHHSSKIARRAEATDVRGATALFDGARVVLTLQGRSDGRVLFDSPKANYAPKAGRIVLTHETGGFLRVVSSAELETATDAAKAEAIAVDIEAILEAVRHRGGRVEVGADALIELTDLPRSRGRKALRHAIDRRLLVEGGRTRGRWYAVPSAAEGGS